MDLDTVIQKVKSVRKRKANIMYHLYMESRNLVEMNLFAKQNRDTDVQNKCMDIKGERTGAVGRLGLTHTHVLNSYLMRTYIIAQGTLLNALW